MIKRLTQRLRRFRRNEDGMATIEFVFWFPIFMITTYSGVEIGIVAYNHANLERALDETIQDVRMNRIEVYDQTPGAQWTHTLLKQVVCDKAGAIPKCFDNLAIEMTSINPFAASTVLNGSFQQPYCVDTPEDIRGGDGDEPFFDPGTSNQLMIIRACAEIDPLFFGTTLGRLTRFDPIDDQYELHVATVFVHEPF